MNELLVDIGNSRVKWARATGGALGEQVAAVPAGWTAEDWRAALYAPDAGPVDRTVVASVAGGASLAALDSAARAATGRGIERITTQVAAAGVVNGYADPDLLGVDRWLAMVGAYRRVRNACAVVDIGTAATFDLVDGQGRHRGGYIVPGPMLMVASLLQGTSDLATFRATSPPGSGAAFADNTRDAIETGCRVAVAAWIGRCMHDAAGLVGRAPRLVLTGGGLPQVQPWLDAPGEAVADLVLRGLFEVSRRAEN